MKLKNKETEKEYPIDEFMYKFTKLVYTSFETILKDEECTYILDSCGNWEYLNTDIWEVIEE
jgi:hypothetical protein